MSKRVIGHKGRDRWHRELAANGGALTNLELRVALALAGFFNCTTEQCNPGYGKLAAAVNAKTDSVKKVCRNLEISGWIKRHRSAGGQRAETTHFELLHPDQGVSHTDTPTGVEACCWKHFRGRLHIDLAALRAAPIFRLTYFQFPESLFWNPADSCFLANSSLISHNLNSSYPLNYKGF